MKIDFSQVLKNLDGQPMTYMEPVEDENGDPVMESVIEDGQAIEEVKKKKIEYTLGKVCMVALTAVYKDEEKKDITPEQKLERFRLALLTKEDNPDLKSEDIVLIKKLVAKGFGLVIYGRVFELLEGHGTKEGEE